MINISNVVAADELEEEAPESKQRLGSQDSIADNLDNKVFLFSKAMTQSLLSVKGRAMHACERLPRAATPHVLVF